MKSTIIYFPGFTLHTLHHYTVVTPYTPFHFSLSLYNCQGAEIQCIGPCCVPHTCAHQAGEDEGPGPTLRLLPVASLSESYRTADCPDICPTHKVENAYLTVNVGKLNLHINPSGQ